MPKSKKIATKKRLHAANNFHPPANFPEKAKRYAQFVRENRNRLPDFAGTGEALLKRLEGFEKALASKAKATAKAQAALDAAAAAALMARQQGFAAFQEQLDNARSHASHHGLQWLAKALARFKTHGSHGRPSDRARDAAKQMSTSGTAS